MALVLNNVTKKFGEHTAVDNLTIDVSKEELFGFLGGNGAGKTTTFRMILGLLDQTEGTIFWNNEPINYEKSHLIGYLPEERGLFPKLSVEEQLIYLGKLRGMNKRSVRKEINKWLDLFKIPQYLKQKIEELSKGNQQKIQFISAVLHKPELLILDEPFSGLDPINVEMIKEAIYELKQKGTTIVFSSHQMAHVEEMCENLCILHQGKPVVQGNLRQIKQSYDRKNVTIYADMSLEFLRQFTGVISYQDVIGGCKLQIENETVSQQIFSALQNKGFVRKFEVEELSLSDIFIEKVGASYE